LIFKVVSANDRPSMSCQWHRIRTHSTSSGTTLGRRPSRRSASAHPTPSVIPLLLSPLETRTPVCSGDTRISIRAGFASWWVIQLNAPFSHGG